MGCKEQLRFWKSYVFVLTPIVALAMPLIGYYVHDREITCDCPLDCPNNINDTNANKTVDVNHPYFMMSKTGYVLIVMAVYWITECIPIAVTALLPAVFLPVLGLVPASKVSPLYWNDINMMFIGGLIVAVSVERWNLHKRIALRLLTLFGTKPRWLLMGFMLPSWFLSMWISNTATTAMMIPIVEAVLEQVKEHQVALEKEQQQSALDNLGYESTGETVVPGQNGEANGNDVTTGEVAAKYDKDTETVDIGQVDVLEESGEEDDSPANKRFIMFSKCLSLSVAYAATTGGISTLTGTAPNLVMKANADAVFEEYGGAGVDSGITFASWITFGLPTSILMLLLVWIWLQLWFIGIKEFFSCKKTEEERLIHEVLKKEYAKLGSMTFAEVAVLVHFIILAVFWLSRKPDVGDSGWSVIMTAGYPSDSTPAILVAASLFFFPSQRPRWLCCKADDEPKKGPVRPLLTWEEAQKGVPFGVILLLGGGFALAESFKATGLSEWMGVKMAVFGDLNPVLMMIILIIITASLTEVTSNTAIASIVMPIFANMSIALGKNPLYLMFPTALACSFAFMLPVATPPNAVVFSYGRVKVIDMMKAGWMLNIIGVLAVVLATNTWGMALFKFDELPSAFASIANGTTDINGTDTVDLCNKYVKNLAGLCSASTGGGGH